jgi:hypothetical protein
VWRVPLPYKNSGQWTAHYIRQNIVAFQGAKTAIAPNCIDGVDDSVPVAPDEGYRWEITIIPPSTDKDIADIKNGTIPLFILGCITYRDALNNRAVTPVCEIYDAALNAYGFCQLIPNKEQQQPQAQPNPEPPKPFP